MVKRGNLNVPVIGVAKSGWSLDQLKARARDSVEKHGGLDAAAFERLSSLLRYVDGDYKEVATFQAIRQALGSARHPAYYLAIPPGLFGLVVEQLAKSGCTAGARVIIEKPFGQDLASAQELNRILLRTFAALQLEIDAWRWQGASFYIRAGKRLPVTCAEILVQLRRPPTRYGGSDLAANHFRFRISPEVTQAIGLNAMAPGEDTVSQSVEMIVSRHPRAGEMDAYERLLEEAMASDATLFAREDYVEEAWRIVDPVLKAGTPVYEYEPGSWGPSQAEVQLSPPGGRQNPVVTG